MKITANADGTYLFTPEDDEGEILAWALKAHDPNILVAVLGGWLRGEREYMRSRNGATAIETIKAIPLLSVGKAVDTITELTAEQKTKLKDAIKALVG